MKSAPQEEELELETNWGTSIRASEQERVVKNMAKRAELRTGRETSLTIRAREQAWVVKNMAKRAELRTGRGTSLTIRVKEQAWAVKSMAKKVGPRTPEINAGEKIFTATTKIFRATRLKCVPAKAANKEALPTASMP